jgi:hypothetical protein
VPSAAFQLLLAVGITGLGSYLLANRRHLVGK